MTILYNSAIHKKPSRPLRCRANATLCAMLHVLMVVILLLASQTAKAQVFAHYAGYANTKLNAKGMQQVSEVHYYYYVSEQGNSFALDLPLLNYTSSGNDTEPRNYFRWYDYTTDKASTNLSATGSYLQSVTDADGTDRGLIGIKLYSNGNKNPCRSTIGVNYVPPASATSESWKGDIIACDVSRYNDFGGKGGDLTAEPTLSTRYIFHILPARQLAESIVRTTSTDLQGRYSDLTIEDNRRIVFGAKDANARIMLRTNMPKDRYFFYPLKTTTHHVYSADEAHKIKSTDFNTSSLQASKYILWRAYDQTKTKYTDLYSYYQQLVTDGLSMNIIQNNGNGWRTLDGTSTTKPTINFGDVVYIVAYARNGDNLAPIANFEIVFRNTYPKTYDEIVADGDNDRTVSYLDSHYQQATKPISFDDDNNEMDLSAPTTPDNNMSRLPSKWDRRSYGFTYYALKDFCPASTTARKWWLPRTPIHGEYGLYKSANLKGVSDEASGYVWWNTSAIVYDRTYEATGGKQYGHFLYIDASDESRQVAAADFKANLCSGARLIFSGAIADLTVESGTQPQVLFKLYGIIRDDNNNITDQRLIVSFASGDFKTNIKSRQIGKWHQVYSKVILPRNSGAENYSDFRIVMDNMCASTNGADYLIDDLRLYITPAKVDAVQNAPVCPTESNATDMPKHVTLKLRAPFDIMHGMLEDKASHVFYRICDDEGNPVSTIDYDGDGTPDAYGTAEVPAAYDATKMLPAAAADGKTDVPMFETDELNNTLIIFANRYFNLPMGKTYYVSLAYPDTNDESVPGTWGVPTNVCSTYSEEFEIVKQGIIVTDANGNVVTNIRVSCDDDRTPNVNIIARLETADPSNGGKVTLGSVKFDWFMGRPDEDNLFQQIAGLQEALANYRATYPEATNLLESYEEIDSTGYALLKKYVDEGQLVIAASNDLNGYRFGKDMIGLIKVAAIPIATTIVEGKTTYEICPDPMYFMLRIVEDGPKLTLGFRDVVYPNDDRIVRIGLPQIRAMVAKDKPLILPITSLESSKSISFNNESHVFISDTNDPTFSSDKQIVGTLLTTSVTTESEQLAVKFDRSALTTMHEGYWYEINFSFSQVRVGTEQVVSCPGETFITLKVVPEYLTWNSTTANKYNANWNNDVNWLRSTAAQIYKDDYTDYSEPSLDYSNAVVETRLTRQQAYVPMKFSKVTIVDQTGRVYPDLGNVIYRQSNKIATKLTNNKGEEATSGIAYDISVKWNYESVDHSDTGDGTFSCEKFQGNVCDAIYFKPHTELRDACYLVYQRAYVEKELEPNKWYIASSPLRDTYAGDMYVPKANGRQQTEAFKTITFDPDKYSRTAYPFYQRTWDSHASEEVDGITSYEAYGYDGTLLRIDTISDASLNIESLYWSHAYNKADVAYTDGKAFSIKAGDIYTITDKSPKALLRLPKADTEYSYFDYANNESALKATVNKDEAYRLLVDASTTADDYSATYQPLPDNIHSSNGYFMLGNPYTATLSMYQFMKGNTAFVPKIWTLEAGKLEAHNIDMTSTNDQHNDVYIEPMQAFFVKLADGFDKPSAAYFTTMMTLDRWLIGGANQQNSDPSISILASSTDGERQSVARIVKDTDASGDFDELKDVELLCNTDLDDVPQVFSVAGTEAVALNYVPQMTWLPIGIVAKKEAIVELSFKLSKEFGENLWLYDAKTREAKKIEQGSAYNVETCQYGRYYITTLSSIKDSQTNQPTISCYAIGNGRIAIGSMGEKLQSVAVYSTSGILLTQQSHIDNTNCVVLTKKGIGIVRVTTENGRTIDYKILVK